MFGASRANTSSPRTLIKTLRFPRVVSTAPPAALARLIRMQIEEDGPIPFDLFMEYALYHPEHGYYRQHEVEARAGPQGDFITAPTLTPFFGAALAHFVAAAWERLGKPLSWWYVEAGGGTGALSQPLVRVMKAEHGAAAHGMHVALTDQFPEHLRAARQGLTSLLPEHRFRVGQDVPHVDGHPVVLVANELLDNLPVRLLYHRAEGWVERCVSTRDDGGFEWADTPAPESLKRWVADFGIDCPVDHMVEVPVGARDWLHEVTKRVGDAPAAMVLIDYGETARDLLGEPRPMGTLTAFERHQQDRDVLRDPGTRDVTAHVNWTAIARMAEKEGWHLVGYTKQGGFLAGLGLLETVAQLGSSVESEEQFAAMQAVKDVLLPGGMGESFKVMGLVRNLPKDADTNAPWPGFGESRPVDPQPRR